MTVVKPTRANDSPVRLLIPSPPPRGTRTTRASVSSIVQIVPSLLSTVSLQSRSNSRRAPLLAHLDRARRLSFRSHGRKRVARKVRRLRVIEVERAVVAAHFSRIIITREAIAPRNFAGRKSIACWPRIISPKNSSLHAAVK